MKKIYTLIPLFVASALSAASYDSLLGTRDTAVETDSLITISTTNEQTFWSTDANYDVKVSTDYSFDKAVLFKNTGSSGVAYFHNYASNGAKLSYDKGFTIATTKTTVNDKGVVVPSNSNIRLVFSGDLVPNKNSVVVKENGKDVTYLIDSDGNRFSPNNKYDRSTEAVVGKFSIISQTGNLLDSSSKFKDFELILQAANFTIGAKEGINSVYLGKYTHLYFGSTINLSTNVTMGTLCGRQTLDNTENVYFGTIKLNGYSFQCGDVGFNRNTGSSIQGGTILVDMANGDGIFKSTGNNGLAYNSAYQTGMDFINFDLDDQILFKTKLSDSALSTLTINGLSGEDILMKEVMIGKDTYYSYYVIPEPSTYAMIFGAIALGFVAYRRRK